MRRRIARLASSSEAADRYTCSGAARGAGVSGVVNPTFSRASRRGTSGSCGACGHEQDGLG
jgi:hypothetical protein